MQSIRWHGMWQLLCEPSKLFIDCVIVRQNDFSSNTDNADMQVIFDKLKVSVIFTAYT